MTFAQLNTSEPTLKASKGKEYTSPTPFQQQDIQGNKSQNARQEAFNNFKTGKLTRSLSQKTLMSSLT